MRRMLHRMRGVEEERSEEGCAMHGANWRCWWRVRLGEQSKIAAFQTLLRGANAMRRSVLLLGALRVVVCCKLMLYKLRQGVLSL